jgi:multidrug efflux system outer membrane protein
VQKRAQNAALRMVKLSDSRFRNGLSSRLDLLDARQSELQTQRRTQQVRTAQYQVTVGLVKALGGAW